jgi:hypothetical protein
MLYYIGIVSASALPPLPPIPPLPPPPLRYALQPAFLFSWALVSASSTCSTIFQPFFNHFSTIFQPFFNHFSTIFQPFFNHFSSLVSFFSPPRHCVILLNFFSQEGAWQEEQEWSVTSGGRYLAQ